MTCSTFLRGSITCYFDDFVHQFALNIVIDFLQRLKLVVQLTQGRVGKPHAIFSRVQHRELFVSTQFLLHTYLNSLSEHSVVKKCFTTFSLSSKHDYDRGMIMNQLQNLGNVMTIL